MLNEFEKTGQRMVVWALDHICDAAGILAGQSHPSWLRAPQQKQEAIVLGATRMARVNLMAASYLRRAAIASASLHPSAAAACVAKCLQQPLTNTPLRVPSFGTAGLSVILAKDRSNQRAQAHRNALNSALQLRAGADASPSNYPGFDLETSLIAAVLARHRPRMPAMALVPATQGGRS
ncbi:hypothetical protein BDV96DRAFT_652151 [Lophiotrema nucula]|uniref:Uncharacterized protein n=1 Tax=Lophiotrema nucula TaxID=690887 RepID=A0A6A5YQ95_9PLEO|nr:hypothetical protein BDV96DRAFT_652151 [Lophiotrema nucula]